jgi:hypothetical protein
MCFFDQIRWSCGFWRWGNFREQCAKEYRTGETCGLKLVFETDHRKDICGLCEQIAKKQRRLKKMAADIDRWTRDGNRTATLEKARGESIEVQRCISELLEQHKQSMQGMLPVSRSWPGPWSPKPLAPVA